MKITKKLKMALRALLMKAGEVETDKGKLIYEGELQVGTEVYTEKVEGEEIEVVPAPDGSYETSDKVIEVEDGKVKSIEDKGEEETEEPEP